MNTLEARRRLLGRNVYKRTTEGNPAIAQDSLARMYLGITMKGWTEQDSTTGAQLFNKSTAISGKYISDTDGEEFDGEDTYASDYIAVSGLSNISCSNTKFRMWMAFYDAEKTYVSGKIGYDAPIPVPENAFYARFTIANDSIGSFMLNEGTTALPYEPYTGGKPSPSPEYPQEIVSAGTQNQETGKWEYEITIANAQTDLDKNQTVTLTSDRPLTKWDKLEKRNGQWGWVYKSAEIVLDGSEDETISLYVGLETEGDSFMVGIPDSVGGYQTSLCDKYRNIDGAWNGFHKGEYVIYSDHSNVAIKNRYFRPPSAEVQTVEQWRTWLSQNPLTLWYETTEETFVPLSETEQEVMNALHTYRPTTVLSNDCDCNMILTYKTKKSMGGG